MREKLKKVLNEGRVSHQAAVPGWGGEGAEQGRRFWLDFREEDFWKELSGEPVSR